MSDQINPPHYRQYPVEVIELTEHMNFNRGNAVKYLARAGAKPEADELVDLEKARWYVDREIKRVQAARENSKIAELRTALGGGDAQRQETGTTDERAAK